jgi:uncharacterized caspase-like protein
VLQASATREQVLKGLHNIATEVGPDDVFVLFLAGHGFAHRLQPNVFEPRSFTFAGPTFDVANPKATGIASQDLYDAIVAIPCRKILLLDCCHSGSANVLREFVPDGIGPVMLAACAANQLSYALPDLRHGAFSNSILEAFGGKFAEADADRNEELDIAELSSYMQQRVPTTVELARKVLGEEAVQTPQQFIPRNSGPLVLAKRR